MQTTKEQHTFDFTPQIFRYLEDIVEISDKTYPDITDEISIDNYQPSEPFSAEVEANNQKFWFFLQEIEAIKIEKSIESVKIGDSIKIQYVEKGGVRIACLPKTYFYILDIKKIKQLLNQRNEQKTIRPKTLELVAKEIANHQTGTELQKFLKDCGVPEKMINYPDTKWRMLDKVFRVLDTSQNEKAHQILYKIIEGACHPLMYQGNEEQAKEVENKFNTLLKYDKIRLIYGKIFSGISEEKKYKSPTDYILEALNFFKNEYNKVKLSGLTYEYCIGEIHPTPDQEYSEEYENSLKAVKRLKEAGVITEYELGVETNDNGWWGIANCKIDESKIIDTNQAPATEAKVQELIHKIEITAMPELKVKGLEERIVLQKPKDKKIQLRNFPSDLRWEEVSIQFLNEHEVIIKAKDITLQTTFEAMGFQDEKRKLPNKQWVLLRLLAVRNGELSWGNNNALALKDINKVKKQKQLLSEALKAFFQILDDPFNNYKTDKSYRIKITLVSEPELKDINEREVFEE